VREWGERVDPITLIVAALAAGAVLGVQGTASTMVSDAYAGLKALVVRRLSGRPDAELVLTGHERSPETFRGLLMAELVQAGADHDADLIAAAKTLLDLADEAGGGPRKYTVDARGAKSVQIGDGNWQSTVFNAQADR
jgi:hypothetical protein